MSHPRSAGTGRW
uniref:Uncharacterized protein n=1 Tax=Anguilla anguilla TaxID=7936 RepID=A0A0E9U5C3_ANGAN